MPATIAPALLDARLASGDRYLVMEYLRGEDLAGLLRRRRRLPLAEAAALIDACAAVIGALHQRGIVHRDLKPHNLFIVDSSGPSVRVLDFGIARGERDVELTTDAQVVGTPGYIAPEHLAGGRARLGPEADVYALAVIAFQLITGQRPFPAGDRSAAPAEPVAATSIDPGLPAGLDAVFALALAKVPAERPPTALAFAALFRQAIDGRLPDDAIRRAAVLGLGSPALDDTDLAARLDLAGSTVRWRPR